MPIRLRSHTTAAELARVTMSAIVLTVLTLVPFAGSVSASKDDGAFGWKVLSFPGVEPTRFMIGQDRQIEVIANRSSAVLYRPLAADEAALRFLSWRWRVEMADMTADLSRKGKDDRPLAIHLLFPPTRGDGGEREATGKPDIPELLAEGFVLTYVWGGAQGQGARVPNPYFDGRGWQIILRDAGADTRRWFEEKVNFDHDFEKAFGFAPPIPGFIAISGDSDDSRSQSIGKIADMTFTDE